MEGARTDCSRCCRVRTVHYCVSERAWLCFKCYLASRGITIDLDALPEHLRLPTVEEARAITGKGRAQPTTSTRRFDACADCGERRRPTEFDLNLDARLCDVCWDRALRARKGPR
jgi:hypothetical protein